MAYHPLSSRPTVPSGRRLRRHGATGQGAPPGRGAGRRACRGKGHPAARGWPARAASRISGGHCRGRRKIWKNALKIRLFLLLLACLAAVDAAGAGAAARPEVTAARIGESPERTRFVLEISE